MTRIDDVTPLSIIERVQVFQYLGSKIDESGGALKDIETRMRKARGAFTILGKICRSTVYSVRTKIHICKLCMVSVLVCGCETWLVTEQIKRKLQVFMNHCLRRTLRIFWPNTISNTDLWPRIDSKDNNIEIPKIMYGWIGRTLRKSLEEVCHRDLH